MLTTEFVVTKFHCIRLKRLEHSKNTIAGLDLRTIFRLGKLIFLVWSLAGVVVVAVVVVDDVIVVDVAVVRWLVHACMHAVHSEAR